MSTIRIERMLEVLPNNTIIVPGCEPTSAVTSPTLMAQQRDQGLCMNVTVQLQDALDNIPGSRLEFGHNFNSPRKRWFVLPPFDPDACPCVGEEDWYGVLRELASDISEVEDRFDHCNVIGMGYCPSPGWRDTPAPPTSTYFNEGDSSVFGHYTP